MTDFRAVDAPTDTTTPAAAAPALPAGPPRKSALGFFGALLLLLPFGIAAQLLHRVAGLLFTEVFVFLVPALVAVAGSNLRARAFLRLRPVPPPMLVMAGIAGASCTLVAVAFQGVLQRFVPPAWLESFDVSRLFLGPAWERWMLGAVATFAAPICEELAFRGYLLGVLRLRLGAPASIAIAAALFAVAHLDPVRFLGLAGLGALFGWLAVRAGSIWPAVAAHAGNNAVVSWVLVSTPAAVHEAARPPTGAQLAGATALGLAVLVPALALFRSAAAAAAPDREDPLAPRDPGEPSRAFRPSRVPPALRLLAASGALFLAALAVREMLRSPFS